MQSMKIAHFELTPSKLAFFIGDGTKGYEKSDIVTNVVGSFQFGIERFNETR